MNKQVGLIFFVYLSGLTMLSYRSANAQKFFEVDAPDQAQVKIFFVEDDAVCDIKVNFVYTAEEATIAGHWMEVDDPTQADIKIIFVDDPALADLNLCMALNPAEAGWLKDDKKSLLPF